MAAAVAFYTALYVLQVHNVINDETCLAGRPRSQHITRGRTVWQARQLAKYALSLTLLLQWPGPDQASIIKQSHTHTEQRNENESSSSAN